MNKDEIVRYIASKTGATQSSVEEIITMFFNLITDALVSGKRVKVNGFGMFESKERKARTGRNPHTGESIPIPARRVPVFKPAKGLRDKVA